MTSFLGSRSEALVTQTVIRVILITLLFISYFFNIQFLKDIEIYLMIYLAYLLVIPPIITYKQNPTITKAVETPIRKKFVTAEDELDKAVEIVADNPEDAMGFLRTAIDLSIKAKFRFKKITKMHGFFIDAEKFNLPMPSYNLIYTIFNEGSKRLHEGKIHTPFEASQAIDLVTDFIAELEKTSISDAQIKDFKNKCNFVE